MTLKSYLSHAVAKPLIAGVVAGLGDHFIMGNPHYQLNAQFAGAVGGAILLASNVEQIVSPYFPTSTPMGHIGKALEGRIVEIACGSAGAAAFQKFVLKKMDYDMATWGKRIAVIAAADIAGETICEILMLV